MSDLVEAVGPAVWARMTVGASADGVAELFLADPVSAVTGARGEITLGLGVVSAEQGMHLVSRCGQVGAPALVLAWQSAHDPQVQDAARQADLTLLALRPEITWTHLVWVLRGILDSAERHGATRDPAHPGQARSAAARDGAYGDLFVLADAVAGILRAPVTIEDHRSRVLAHSSEHQVADPARISTIVGRKVPPDVLAYFQARGVFRRLATSSEPFLVPAGPEGIRPRFVIPVRAGEEWLGSIWALVEGEVDPDAVTQVAGVASALALELLRLRAQADLARRRAALRLREALEGVPGIAADVMLPPGPWRVAALTGPRSDASQDEQLELWVSTLRRHSWAEPSLTTLDRTVLAVVTTGNDPGSWDWLCRIVSAAHRDDPAVRVAAGTVADSITDLPRSQREALETLAVGEPAPVATYEQSWAARTLRRATAGIDPERLGGPVTQLAAHDRQHGTRYVETLRAVLRYPGDPTRAARSLHVHPNTLRHRMRRMDEVARLDLADWQTRLALMVQVEAAGTTAQAVT